MIDQLGTPTLFFTLSSVDTKWADLHSLFPQNTNPSIQNSRKHLIDNIIQNPHITSLYIHQRFTIFREEVIEKLLQATNYWYRYEWQHRQSGHVHGFIWLPNAPNMDTLDWNNKHEIDKAQKFFDNYVSAWNPRDQIERHNRSHHTANDDPCTLNTQKILSLDPLYDYE